MITSFEVGARLRLLDEFSPALRKLLGEIRELNKVLEQDAACIELTAAFRRLRAMVVRVGGGWTRRRAPIF